MNRNTVLNNIITFFRNNLSDHLGSYSVAEYVKGFRDPGRLKKYNALLFTIDRSEIQRNDLAVNMPVSIMLVVKGNDETAVITSQLGIGDAIWNLIDQNRTLGGACWSADIETIEDFIPLPGNQLTAVSIITIPITLDIMSG